MISSSKFQALQQEKQKLEKDLESITSDFVAQNQALNTAKDELYDTKQRASRMEKEYAQMRQRIMAMEEHLKRSKAVISRSRDKKALMSMQEENEMLQLQVQNLKQVLREEAMLRQSRLSCSSSDASGNDGVTDGSGSKMVASGGDGDSGSGRTISCNEEAREGETDGLASGGETEEAEGKERALQTRRAGAIERHEGHCATSSLTHEKEIATLRRELVALREKSARSDAAHATDIERLIGEKQELAEEARILRNHLAANAKRQKSASKSRMSDTKKQMKQMSAMASAVMATMAGRKPPSLGRPTRADSENTEAEMDAISAIPIGQEAMSASAEEVASLERAVETGKRALDESERKAKKQIKELQERLEAERIRMREQQDSLREKLRSVTRIRTRLASTLREEPRR